MTAAQPLATNIAKQRKGNTNTYTKTFDIETSSASYVRIPSPSNIIAAKQVSNIHLGPNCFRGGCAPKPSAQVYLFAFYRVFVQ
jgi:hypothetical protein